MSKLSCTIYQCCAAAGNKPCLDEGGRNNYISISIVTNMMLVGIALVQITFLSDCVGLQFHSQVQNHIKLKL